MGEGRGEELGALEEAGGDEEAAIGAALDGEFGGRGVALGDEELGGGDEVVEDVLLLQAGAGFVPGLAVFAAAAEAGLGEEAAELHPEEIDGGEGGQQRDVEAAVAVEEGGGGGGAGEAAAAGEKDGDAGAVRGGVDVLDGLEEGGVEVEFGGPVGGGGEGAFRG